MGWLSRNRSWIRHEGWLSRGGLPSAESSVWRLKDGCGGVEVPDGWRGVGKRLQDSWGNGCEKVVVELRLVVSVSGVESGSWMVGEMVV